MLCLNTYGIQRPKTSSNQSLTLPKIAKPNCFANGSDTFTYSLNRFAQQQEHPCFLTSNKSAFGRRLDCRDIGLLAANKKLLRKTEFTKEFLTGPFSDSRLGSVEIRKKRAEASITTKNLRGIQFANMHREKLQISEEKRKIRQESRRQRKLEMHRKKEAATMIQKHIRGCKARVNVKLFKNQIQNDAAIKIQELFKSQERVRIAKMELQNRKMKRDECYAICIQTTARQYLLRKLAIEESNRRRKIRDEEMQVKISALKRQASTKIQSQVRGLICRKSLKLRRQQSEVVISKPIKIKSQRSQKFTSPNSNLKGSKDGKKKKFNAINRAIARESPI